MAAARVARARVGGLRAAESREKRCSLLRSGNLRGWARSVRPPSQFSTGYVPDRVEENSLGVLAWSLVYLVDPTVELLLCGSPLNSNQLRNVCVGKEQKTAERFSSLATCYSDMQLYHVKARDVHLTKISHRTNHEHDGWRPLALRLHFFKLCRRRSVYFLHHKLCL